MHTINWHIVSLIDVTGQPARAHRFQQANHPSEGLLRLDVLHGDAGGLPGGEHEIVPRQLFDEHADVMELGTVPDVYDSDRRANLVRRIDSEELTASQV